MDMRHTASTAGFVIAHIDVLRSEAVFLATRNKPLQLLGWKSLVVDVELLAQTFNRTQLILGIQNLERLRQIGHLEMRTQEAVAQAEREAERAAQMQNVQYQHTDYAEAPAEDTQSESRAVAEEHPGTLRNVAPKIGRNDPCPCGSGKKYKHCHGQLS